MRKWAIKVLGGTCSSLFLSLFLCFPSLSWAEEIAILQSAEIGAYSEAIQAFKAALPPSASVTLEYNLQGDLAKGRSLAKRIRASDAQVVFAVGLKAALAAKLEILDIPIIFGLVLNPQKYGLPTSNMVGISLDIPFETNLKTFQTLIPDASTLGVLFDPQKTQGLRDQLEKDAKAKGLTIIAKAVTSEQDVARELKTLENRIDALWLLPDSTVLTENTLDFLISSTLEANIPVIGFSKGLVQSGALVGVHLDYADIGKQAAKIAQQTLSPSATPITGAMVPPERIHRSINRKTATYLSVPLNSTIMGHFDEQY